MNQAKWQAGDWVRVNPGGQRRSKEQRMLEGEIVYVGHRFAVVQLPGYRESFWLDELRPIEADAAEDESALQERVLAWLDT